MSRQIKAKSIKRKPLNIAEILASPFESINDRPNCYSRLRGSMALRKTPKRRGL